jgi:hypothetical protein
LLARAQKAKTKYVLFKNKPFLNHLGQISLSNYLVQLVFKSPERYGVLLALIGVLVLTPDTLVIKISELGQWPLMGWRSLLMGTASLIIWRTFLAKDPSCEWSSLLSWQGILVIAAFSMNSATFTLGIVETSASVVLTALATMPVFTAVLSFLMLDEKQGWLGWLAILVSMFGVISFYVWCNHRSHGWRQCIRWARGIGKIGCYVRSPDGFWPSIHLHHGEKISGA